MPNAAYDQQVWLARLTQLVIMTALLLLGLAVSTVRQKVIPAACQKAARHLVTARVNNRRGCESKCTPDQPALSHVQRPHWLSQQVQVSH